VVGKAFSRFRAYLDYITTLDHLMFVDNLNSDNDEKDSDAEPEPEETEIPSNLSTHSLSVRPAFPHMDINTLSTCFKAMNFVPTLSTYIHCLVPPPALPFFSSRVDQFDVYKHVTILQPPKMRAGFSNSVDRVRATPSIPAKGRSKAASAHFDTVLIHAMGFIEPENQHTKGTCLEGE
jgi:hypothetical protein